MRAKIISLTLFGVGGVLVALTFLFGPEPSPSKATGEILPDQTGHGGKPTAEHVQSSTPVQKSSSPASNVGVPAMHGLLIDAQEKPVVGGDVLFKYIPKQNKHCEEKNLDFDLDPDTGAVRSDIAGRFSVPLPGHSLPETAGCLVLNASKEGYIASVVSLDLDQPHGTVELELERYRTLNGRVRTPDGTALRGARVSSWFARSQPNLTERQSRCDSVDQRSLVHAESGDEGYFSLGITGNNQFCLQASHPDWAGSTPRVISSTEAGAEEFVLTLEFPTRVAGQALGPGGTPVADLPLQLNRVRKTVDFGPVVSMTNAAGRFVFPGLDAVEYQLSSGNPAYAVANPKQISVKLGESLEDLSVDVFPVTLISGRLVDTAGRPVSGVHVSARSPYVPDLSLTSTSSDASGHFEIQSEHRSKTVHDMLAMASEFSEETRSMSSPSTACLSFYHPQLRADERTVSVTEARLNLGTIHMEPPLFQVNGVIKNHRGEPIEADLTFNYLNQDRGPHSNPPAHCHESTAPRKTRSDAQGAFSLHVDQPGRYEVEVNTDRYQQRRLQVDLSQAHAQLELKLR